jgi:hypothetical protein
VSKRVHEFFDKHPAVKKGATALVQALKTALKQVVQIIVPHTLHLVFEAIANGVKKKLEALFEDTFVGESIEKFKTWYAAIKDYAEQAQAYIETVHKGFLDMLPDWVGPLLDDVKWFWRIVKAGRALLKCRKPPILGCLSLLKSAATDQELQCLLCIPWVQK